MRISDLSSDLCSSELSSVEFPVMTLPYPPQYWFSAVARKNGAGIAFVSSPFPHLHTVTRVRHLGNLTIHLQVTSKSPQRPLPLRIPMSYEFRSDIAVST